jgi:hypothetical protein
MCLVCVMGVDDVAALLHRNVPVAVVENVDDTLVEQDIRIQDEVRSCAWHLGYVGYLHTVLGMVPAQVGGTLGVPCVGDKEEDRSHSVEQASGMDLSSVFDGLGDAEAQQRLEGYASSPSFDDWRFHSTSF